MLRWRRGERAGGGWPEALGQTLGRQHHGIVEYVRTGATGPLPPAAQWVEDPALLSLSPADLQARGERHRRLQWRAVMLAARPDWPSITRTMDIEQLSRFGWLVGANRQVGRVMAPADWLRWALDNPASQNDLPNQPLARIEEAGHWLGYGLDEMVSYLFTVGSNRPRHPDLLEWSAANLDAIAAVMASAVAADVGRWARVAWGGSALVGRLSRELVAAATSSAQTTRAAVRDVLALVDLAVIEDDLKAAALDGPPASRAEAVTLLAGLAELASTGRHDDMRAWLVEHCGADRAPAVREAVDRTTTSAAPPASTEGGGAKEPRLLALKSRPPLPPRFEQRLLATWPAGDGDDRERQAVLWAARIVAELDGSARFPARRGTLTGLLVAMESDPSIGEGLAPMHLAQALLSAVWQVRSRSAETVALIHTAGHPSPLEIQAAAAVIGLSPTVAHSVVTLLLADPAHDTWPDAEVAAWARHQLPALERYLTESTDKSTFSRPGLFRALATVEPRPDTLTRALLASGLSGLKADRPLARQALAAEARDAVVAALGAKKVADRVGAAQWLRELRDPTTEAELRAAVDREQADTARVAMLQALEAIGSPLDEYLAASRLVAEAEAALARKNAIPAAMAWLPFEGLPTVHWTDGNPVDPRIFQWFAASAVKAKSIEPSPLLRHYVELMSVGEVRRFADAMFEAWVARDLAPRPRDECERIAALWATWKTNLANQFPNVPSYAAYRGLTVEQGTLLELPAVLDEPAGSATDSKCLFAVVAAMGGPELAPKVLSYLKRWRGSRLHQGKAMLEMLAWTEHPAAIQVVLTVAQRFRPRSLQAAAAYQTERLAERRGWTIDDLADRTVPSSGFDDDGRLTVDYGSRTFTAHLRHDLTIELVVDATGKAIKSLPAARQDEDDDEVKALRQDLAVARKEVRATATLQPERLFVSMCAGRSWDADDYLRYLIQHPVMRRLATRLAWIAEPAGSEPGPGGGPGEGRRLFRPLSDGTLLDIDGGEVVLGGTDRVLIAHDAYVPVEEAERWLAHFQDYEVVPLFPQFGRPRPPAGAGTAIDAVMGHLIDARTLRGVITRLGWQLGEAQDAGFVNWIHKPFPAADLSAVLEIAGIPSILDDSVTALRSLYYTPPALAGSLAQAVPLADVPPILLLETYSEALAIAAAGTGYDPDYLKKSNW